MMFNKVYLGATPISNIFLGDVPIKYQNNIVAKYTVNNIKKTSPALMEGELENYAKRVRDNGDGTYTVTITADYAPTSISFKDNTSLLSVDYINISNITDMSYMFAYCSNLESVNMSNWDTSNVNDVQYMFHGCSKLHTLHLDKCSDTTVSNIINSYSFPTNIINGSTRTIYCRELAVKSLTAPENWEFSYIYNTIAIYTVNNINKTSPYSVSNKAEDWRETVINNGDGTYTVTITADYAPTSIDFRSNSALLSIDYLDTSKINDMSYMFYNCDSLTELDLSNWNTSRVTDMSHMFNYCDSLTSLDLSNWNTSRVTDMEDMFRSCDSLTELDLSNWNISNVNITKRMFYYCDSLVTLHLDNCSNDTINKIITSDGFPTDNISGVTKTIYCKSENTVGLVAPSYWIFIDAVTGEVIEQEIPDITVAIYTVNDTTKISPTSVTNKAINWEEEVVDNEDGTYTVTITAIYAPTKISFENNKALLSIDYLDTSNVTSMYRMFSSCTSLTTIDTSSFDTSNVTNMSRMFYNCQSLKLLDVSNFDTSDVTDMMCMFEGCHSLAQLDLSNFDTSKVTNMQNMFRFCHNLTSINVSNFDTSNVTDMDLMFSSCNKLTTLDLSSFNTSKVTTMDSMFFDCSKLHTLYLNKCDEDTVSDIITSSSFPTNTIEDVTRTIYCRESEAIDLTVPENWEFSYVILDYDMIDDNVVAIYTVDDINKTSPYEVANKAEDWKETVVDNKNGTYTVTITASYAPTYIDFDRNGSLLYVDYINTSNIVNMATMFWNCYGLRSVDTRNWDTSNVSNMNGMFYGCLQLRLIDVSSFDTSNVVYMDLMFYDCNKLTTLDLSSFNTTNVISMSSMFCGCESLTELNLSNWDTSNVSDMEAMFSSCKSLTSLDLSNFNTSNVTSMNQMFSSCESLTTLDLSNFDTSNVTDMSYPFRGCSLLHTLHLDNCSNDTINKIITSQLFPTGPIGGVTKTVYCKSENAAGLTKPYNWVFSYVS